MTTATEDKAETSRDNNIVGSDTSHELKTTEKKYKTRLSRLFTPKTCRWDAQSPPELTTGLCILYALSATFTVANLYYAQPILNKIAQTFNVSYEESSQVLTLIQSGYAAGLILVLPLGDLLERRMLIISLVLITATLWIGLCVTTNFTLFRVISFICGLATVTPQLMIPLVGDFSPANRRAASVSIVVSGLLFGMLIARLLSGVVTAYSDWRNIYWFACAAQYLLAISLYAFMPDYPSTNPDGLGYLKALSSVPYMMMTEPILIQASLIVFCLACVFTSFWTTLTFLLVSPPYEFSSLSVGLFSLLSLITIVAAPFLGRAIDRFEPLISILNAQLVMLVGVAIGTFVSPISVAGPILQGVGIDLGMQTVNIANRLSIFKINPKARNRVNTAYMALAFSGQLTGTAVSNRLYAAGGWRWSGGSAIAFVGVSIGISLARGPRETGWIGWAGGWPLRPNTSSQPKVESISEAQQA